MQYGFFHGSATLLSVSEKHMAYAQRLGFPPDRCFYVPNGLDMYRVNSIEFRDRNKEFDFLIFGWDYYRKGVDLCIAATQRINLACRVAIVAKSLPTTVLPERVTRIDPVSDINELYSRTRCFLHLSRAEGFSYALLEALFAGLPVICSDIPENRFASQCPTAVMVKNENVDEIICAMTRILESTEPKADDVLFTRNVIRNQYSVQAWVNRIICYYGI